MTDKWAILNYEIQMYLGARLLQGVRFQSIPGLRGLSKTLQESAITEVKALHIRILVDIFLARKQGDDINIDDLLPNWRDNNKTVAHNLDIAYNKKLETGRSPKWYLNKFLVHPDKRRGDSFNWAPIIIRMDPVLRDVFRTLPDEKLQALQILQYLH